MTSFENLEIGPAISIINLEQKQETLNDLLDKGLIVVAYITDTTHPAFKLFTDKKPKDEPVAVFLTVAYNKNYE